MLMEGSDLLGPVPELMFGRPSRSKQVIYAHIAVNEDKIRVLFLYIIDYINTKFHFLDPTLAFMLVTSIFQSRL